VRLFSDFSEHLGHPAKLLDSAALVAWSEPDKSGRSTFALEIVPVVEPADMPARARLTRQARALLETSPSPKVALERIIDRLSPQSWSGSRAAIMEVNATALDDVLDLFDGDYQSFAQQAKAQLLTKVAEERAQETDRDRMRDERFEW
jgi:hypothetical protein